MDLTKILGSLLASGALSKGSGGDVLGSLIGAALGGSQNQQTQGGGALGDILGSIIAGGQSSGNSGGGLGDILGSLVGGGKSSGAGGLGDILGSLVGGSQSSAGNAGGLGDILGSLVGGATPTHQPRSSGRTPTSASDLEDLLGIGKENSGGLGGAGGLGGLLTSAITKHAQQNNPNVPTPSNDDYSVLPLGVDKEEANNQAALIIRAMINAAKSDGSIDQSEQEKVIAKLGDVTQDEIDFVKREFAATLDVQAFARSIPRGMGEQIYAVSLMAIDLDKNSEAQYLADLAQGLGLSTQVANQIHDKFGVPKIFA
ncbi:MAG TPA: DUF533 domain-containing protein [Epsilonproteobacteria bacterium]|nr:DUF533 domain-containing protein [Campylobacterota bacterium]